MKVPEILQNRDLGYSDLEAVDRLKYIVELFVAVFVDTFCFYRKINSDNIDIIVENLTKHLICNVFLPEDFKPENMEIINLFPKTCLKEVLPNVNVKISIKVYESV